jgi:hypothetical protein
MESTDKLFEKASKIKLRFPTSKGWLSVEDLWDLTVRELDGVYRSVSKEIKSIQEDSLLERKTGGSVFELQIEIIRYVYSVRQDEIEKREKSIARREQIRQLEDIIARKENTALSDKSLEDLRKMRDDLEALA